MYFRIAILCISKRCPDVKTLVAAICSLKDIKILFESVHGKKKTSNHSWSWMWGLRHELECIYMLGSCKCRNNTHPSIDVGMRLKMNMKGTRKGTFTAVRIRIVICWVWQNVIWYLMFCWPCIIVYQYNETKVMHFSFSLLRIKGLYIFRALLAHPQEVLNKQHLVYCLRIT
jgi:hypothetical protein